ncbi:hypothetical protein [Tepidiforma sp.]|jgi:hypothetical protein|uniref:hypothetical protein n=1 Tax=Tepidiforma sp. TaxID=2682230 RepID=UPI0021DEBEB4|nr:hypothetical protein [Tepidiforma sp.]MCX7617214.1 hypothetical protein [Tepidiforma sp.]GIW17166.1 MAG: hypothetical protein KatS3mg064_0323 [Tepidiforma sp.]
MQLDWDKTINEILSEKLACQACGALGDEMVVGYTREPSAAEFAARCRDCTDKSDCDARKLVVVCEPCARIHRVNGELMDETGMMTMMLEECRRNLEDSIDYLSTYWKEETDVSYDEMKKGLHEVDPELFREEDAWRMRLEEEYLQLHRWFREHGVPIPDPGWRSQYVEEVIGLGYTTLLGD